MNNLNPLYEIVAIQQTATRVGKSFKGLPMKQLAKGTKTGYLSNRMARRLGINPSAIGNAENLTPLLGVNGAFVEKTANQNLARKGLAQIHSK